MKDLLNSFSLPSHAFNFTTNVNKDAAKQTAKGGGVYVWRLGETPIRVGKDQKHAHKRALAHIQNGLDRDTSEIMEPIKDHLELDLYLISNESYDYLIPSFEMHAEKDLYPLLPSNIRGKNRKTRFEEASLKIQELISARK